MFLRCLGALIASALATLCFSSMAICDVSRVISSDLTYV